MSESTSDNTSNQSTTYTDARMVLGEGSAYVGAGANSGNTAINSGNTTTTINAVDNGAVRLAFDGINATVKEGFKFGTQALGFAGDTVQESLDFAAQAQRDAASQVNQSLRFAQDTQERSFSQASSALGTATQAMGQALQFGSTQSARAMDSLAGTAELVNRAYADAKGRGAMTDYLIMGAMVLVAFVAWRAAR